MCIACLVFVNMRAVTLLGEVDSVVSDNLEAPHFVVRLCPAQQRPGGLQVF